MFRVSIMYPHQKDTRFDLNYYRTKHMELVKNLLTPFGLIKAEVDRGRVWWRGTATTVYLHWAPIF